jgi:hypothetical protein
MVPRGLSVSSENKEKRVQSRDGNVPRMRLQAAP